MALLPGGPSAAAVGGEALAQTVEGAYQHPEGAVPLFHNHMFVKAAHGNIGAASEGDGLALVGGGVHIGELLVLQAVALTGDAAAPVPPDGLFIMMPWAMRRGADQTNVSASASSQMVTQTPLRPSLNPRAWV